MVPGGSEKILNFVNLLFLNHDFPIPLWLIHAYKVLIFQICYFDINRMCNSHLLRYESLSFFFNVFIVFGVAF